MRVPDDNSRMVVTYIVALVFDDVNVSNYDLHRVYAHCRQVGSTLVEKIKYMQDIMEADIPKVSDMKFKRFRSVSADNAPIPMPRRQLSQIPTGSISTNSGLRIPSTQASQVSLSPQQSFVLPNIKTLSADERFVRNLLLLNFNVLFLVNNNNFIQQVQRIQEISQAAKLATKTVANVGVYTLFHPHAIHQRSTIAVTTSQMHMTQFDVVYDLSRKNITDIRGLHRLRGFWVSEKRDLLTKVKNIDKFTKLQMSTQDIMNATLKCGTIQFRGLAK